MEVAYAHYFVLVARKDKNVTVQCTLCPRQKHLSTAANTTSNLSKHLQRQHANSRLVAKDPRTLSDTDADKRLPLPLLPTPAKQPRLDFQQQVTKAEINRLVAAYIVEEMLPFKVLSIILF